MFLQATKCYINSSHWQSRYANLQIDSPQVLLIETTLTRALTGESPWSVFSWCARSLRCGWWVTSLEKSQHTQSTETIASGSLIVASSSMRRSSATPDTLAELSLSCSGQAIGGWVQLDMVGPHAQPMFLLLLPPFPPAPPVPEPPLPPTRTPLPLRLPAAALPAPQPSQSLRRQNFHCHSSHRRCHRRRPRRSRSRQRRQSQRRWCQWQAWCCPGVRTSTSYS